MAHVTSDGGASWRKEWEILRPPSLEGDEVELPAENMGDVLCTGLQLWGPSGDILRTTDGGQTWNDLGLNDG